MYVSTELVDQNNWSGSPEKWNNNCKYTKEY